MNRGLAVNNITIGYGSNVIISELNFQVKPGELCAIVGVNGIGKSTLIRTLSNLQSLLAGTIYVDGQSITDYAPIELAKKLSLVLTDALATKNLSVHELITLGRQPYTNWIGKITKDDKKRIQEVIDLFELETLVDSKCYELSDGQLQRVLIARAAVQDTPFMILDEPTSHLDLANQVIVLKLLKTLTQKHNKIIIFSTHQIELAIQLCDKIIILDGKDNPMGPPQELINNKSFESIFPSNLIQFDAQQQKFKINNS